MQVSIIIVNFNNKALLYNCLNSIFKFTNNIDFEIIVSDNGSTDDSIQMVKNEFPSVTIIENKENLGFGAANNRALAVAKGEFIFYLNSDTVLLNNAVRIFCDFWLNYENKEELGVLGCILLNGNNEPDHSYGKFPSAEKELKEKFGFKKKENNYTFRFPLEVDYICGAALFLKNDEFAKFDERFFLYFEDSDLQYTLYKANKKRIIIAGPQIIHIRKGSNAIFIKNKYIGFEINHPFSKIKYYKKNKNNYFIILILKLFIIIKWLNPKIIKYTLKHIPKLINT